MNVLFVVALVGVGLFASFLIATKITLDKLAPRDS